MIVNDSNAQIRSNLQNIKKEEGNDQLEKDFSALSQHRDRENVTDVSSEWVKTTFRGFKIHSYRKAYLSHEGVNSHMASVEVYLLTFQ